MLLEEHTSCEQSDCEAYPKGKHLGLICHAEP